MAETDFERTETPTQRRREEARQQGNIVRSIDLAASLALLAAVVLLNVFGMTVLKEFKRMTQLILEGGGGNPTRADDVSWLFGYAGRSFIAAAAPMVLSITAVVFLAMLGQVGFIVTTRPLMPNWERLNPFRGLSHLFDARGRIRMIMSLVKVAVMLAVAGWVIWADLPAMIVLSEHETMPAFNLACGMVYNLAIKLAGLLLLLGILDYAYQYWQRERDLRMTKEEVKEEFKRMEGDPLIKQRRARVARQLAMQRINQSVPRADVVVTNPTHFAVALRYDSQSMTAPKVVAKGADFLAMRIRQLAMMHNVPLVERRELARALYRSVEVGQEIPPQFYSAAAEILAYVYRLNGRKTA